ncbi:MAG: C10 family peptidase [Gammaproteobacteria bacterium]|nr:C10 family peptidase [Gammaproteobacteria bacterium]
MKKWSITILIACLAISVLASPVQAEMATMDEAQTVANNWVTLIIEKKGNWGGSETAEVEEIQEFKRGERVIGYFCRVKPKGFVVVSLHKELAPVKAYSATCDLDPESEEGMADLIKGGMEQVLDWTEQLVGPIESARAEDMDSILEINYRQAWEELEGNVEIFKDRLESSEVEMDYQGGDVLLTSSWRQGDPYNRQCPSPPSGDDCTASRCSVGCVATCGAQTMRYWNWPPTYDWSNMPDILTTSSPQAQIDAVAELCHEVGVKVDMDYCGSDGCASGACFASCIGEDLLDAFEDYFRYSDDADDYDRDDYTAVGWFNLIKKQLNLNRPVPYRVEGHDIVCDGWQEVYIGGVFTRQYHMNYGWADNHNMWWTLDALYLGGKDEEEMLVRIKPAPSLGSWLSGSKSPPSFPYRYFDRDATGHDATFGAGHYLQFLPGITVKCTSPDGGKIQFIGWSTDNTYLFTRGDQSKGIRIHSGHINLFNQGSIKFH